MQRFLMSVKRAREEDSSQPAPVLTPSQEPARKKASAHLPATTAVPTPAAATPQSATYERHTSGDVRMGDLSIILPYIRIDAPMMLPDPMTVAASRNFDSPEPVKALATPVAARAGVWGKLFDDSLYDHNQEAVSARIQHELLTMVRARARFRKWYPDSNWRGKQLEVIESVLTNHNTLAVFPTGGGKSLCYWLPAALLPGLTVVICPLKALALDQINKLKQLKVVAGTLSSDTTPADALEIWRQLRAGDMRVLFVNPEKLATERFLWHVKHLPPISMIVCDEAHCIDEWGQLFRADFQRISHFRKQYCPEAVFLALTATATPDVQRDLCTEFDIATESVFQSGLYRHNLSLDAIECKSEEQMEKHLCFHLKAATGVAIVYCPRRRDTESLAERLRQPRSGQLYYNAVAFHSKMSLMRKERILEDFYAAQSDMVVCATTAFGMGIDKSNVSNIFFYQPSRSVEAYVQVR